MKKPMKNFTFGPSPRALDYTTALKQCAGRLKKPRRNGAPLPLLVPCFLARTRPLLCPRRSMRRRTREPAAREVGPGQRGRLYRRPARAEQPAATAILHGLARRTAPQTYGTAVGAAQAVGRRKKAPPGMGDPAGMGDPSGASVG